MAISEHTHLTSTTTPQDRGEWSYWSGWKPLGKWGGLLMLFCIYFPLAWLALMSISERPLSGIPLPFSLQHYRALFADTKWVEPFGASILIALLVGIVSATVATLVGRALPRTRNPGGLLLLFLLPLFVPGMSLGAALFIFARSVLELKLGFWSIFIGHFVWAFPFSLLIILVLTTRFDNRLIEAASDLGASSWRSFWDIEFPLLMPGIIGAGLFGFLLSFNEVLRTIFLRGTEKTMPVWNWIMAASQQSQVPIIFALATIVLLVTLPLLAGMFWLVFARLDKS
ncbi:ABC transporter permease [Pseudohoeflea coraliihabitans]|uniref:ABC transporter permease subunit n=1 Tax=Pseudohoeflea coraliihabitans TaxID=2860393 RepID=A0ABS6WPY8_9HYPH|nr:ABC transporter permease subunit [Pseudohoeflea sp. DP4N28-3]MBW3098032.1 ABC transporter permease subunit [Pseudohoeflea sp. DP4N28-3]